MGQKLRNCVDPHLLKDGCNFGSVINAVTMMANKSSKESHLNLYWSISIKEYDRLKLANLCDNSRLNWKHDHTKSLFFITSPTVLTFISETSRRFSPQRQQRYCNLTKWSKGSYTLHTLIILSDILFYYFKCCKTSIIIFDSQTEINTCQIEKTIHI